MVAVLKGTLVITKSKEEDLVYQDAFNIGFMQESKNKVIELHKN